MAKTKPSDTTPSADSQQDLMPAAPAVEALVLCDIPGAKLLAGQIVTGDSAAIMAWAQSTGSLDLDPAAVAHARDGGAASVKLAA